MNQDMLLAGKELLLVQVILMMSPGLYLVCRPVTDGLEDGDTDRITSIRYEY